MRKEPSIKLDLNDSKKAPKKQDSTPARPNDRDADRRVVTELGDSAGSAGRAGEALLGGREQLRDAELCVVAERWISGTRQKDERRIAVERRLSGKCREALLRHDLESLRHCVWERRGRVQSREAARGVRGIEVGADGDNAASTGRAGKLSCVLSDGEDGNGDVRWSGAFGGSAGSAGHAERRCCTTISGHRGAAHGDDRVGTGEIAGMCCGE